MCENPSGLLLSILILGYLAKRALSSESLLNIFWNGCLWEFFSSHVLDRKFWPKRFLIDYHYHPIYRLVRTKCSCAGWSYTKSFSFQFLLKTMIKEFSFRYVPNFLFHFLLLRFDTQSDDLILWVIAGSVLNINMSSSLLYYIMFANNVHNLENFPSSCFSESLCNLGRVFKQFKDYILPIKIRLSVCQRITEVKDLFNDNTKYF